MAYAHSPNDDGRPHDLVEHLTRVAEMAAEFAGKFDAADFGYWAGLCTTWGNFTPTFQDYLKAQTEGSLASDSSSHYSVTAF